MEYLLLWTFLKVVDSSFDDPEPYERAPASLSEPIPEVKAPTPPAVKKDPSHWISMGSGSSYINFSQDVSETQKVSSSGPLSSSYSLHGIFLFSPRWGLKTDYQTMSGELNNDSAALASEKTIKWENLNLAALIRLSRSTALSVGAEMKSFPFIYDDGASTIQITQSRVSNYALGLLYQHSFSKFIFDVEVNYFYPIQTESSRGDLSLKQEFAFDSSVGLKYRLFSKVNAGLKWRGQWQRYDFKFRSDASNFNGQQKLSDSVAEFNLGIEL